jgi:hypothetical protein
MSDPIYLDRESLLSCSYSGTGCDGGYFNSLTLDVSVTGIPSSGCMDKPHVHKLSAATGKAQSCDSRCYERQDQLHFTKGFRELRTEEDIEHSLIHNGPVPVGIYMPTGPIDLAEVFSIPPPESSTPYWTYLNHGVVITGWGTDSHGKPFWTVYNPWGMDMKIERNSWFAKYAIEIIPDLCRGYIYTLLTKSGFQPDCN